MTQTKSSRCRRQGRLFPEYTIPPEELARRKVEREARCQRSRKFFDQVSPKLIQEHYNWFILIEPNSGDYFIDNELHPDSKGRWVGNFVSTASFEGLNATGSWAAVLWEVGAKIGHMVIVDSLDKNIVTILDPWDGTKYKMAQDIFLQYWNGQAVYWIEK